MPQLLSAAHYEMLNKAYKVGRPITVNASRSGSRFRRVICVLGRRLPLATQNSKMRSGTVRVSKWTQSAS
jgi:hypothetical protein